MAEAAEKRGRSSGADKAGATAVAGGCNGTGNEMEPPFKKSKKQDGGEEVESRRVTDHTMPWIKTTPAQNWIKRSLEQQTIMKECRSAGVELEKKNIKVWGQRRARR